MTFQLLREEEAYKIKEPIMSIFWFSIFQEKKMKNQKEQYKNVRTKTQKSKGINMSSPAQNTKSTENPNVVIEDAVLQNLPEPPNVAVEVAVVQDHHQIQDVAEEALRVRRRRRRRRRLRRKIINFFNSDDEDEADYDWSNYITGRMFRYDYGF